MKKIFTLMAVAAATLSMSAQTELLFGSSPIADGTLADYNFKAAVSGKTYEVPCEFEEIIPGTGLGIYKQVSDLWLKAKDGADLDFSIIGDYDFECCGFGGCVPISANETFYQSFKMGEYSTQISDNGDLYMYLQIDKTGSDAQPTNDITLDVNVYDYDTDEEIDITVIMLASTEAGISSVILNKDEIKVTDNIMAYSVSKATKLSVYGITGRLAAKYSISGAGTISLNNLPKGVYIYTDGTHKGKFIIK